MNENPTSETLETLPAQPSPTLKSTQDRINEGEPHIKFHEQVIFTKRWPDPKCKHCKGLGYQGTWRQKPQPALTIGRNDKCPCGSGQKLKKCCIKTLTRMRMSGSSVLTCGCAGRAQLADNPQLETLRNQMAKLTG